MGLDLESAITSTCFPDAIKVDVGVYVPRAWKPGCNRMREFLRDVCGTMGIQHQVILGGVRTREISYIRHAIYHVGRYVLGYSTPAIARVMNRDHSTVMHGAKRADRLLRNRDPDFAPVYAQIKRLAGV